MADDGQAAADLVVDATAARRAARFFAAGRPALSQIYTEIERRSAGRLRDFKIVALGLHDTRDAFAAALLETARAGVHRTFLAELAALGVLDLKRALQALSRTAGMDTLLWPQDATTGTLTIPQGWNPTVAATLDMTELLRAVNLAARRVCLVQTGVSQGTGFLIGPQTVLTNWHVMAPLIDPATGLALPGSAQSLQCIFESLAGAQGRIYPAMQDWLVDFSPMAGADAAPDGALPDMTALRPHALDFCALRLAGSPGRERGWYDLSRLGTLNAATDHFFVFQHPFANPQRLAITTGAEVDPKDAAFLRHRAWTDRGSSGGLCLDQRFLPLALHHAAVTDAQQKFLHNRAVRLAAIQAVRPGLGDATPGQDRISVLSDGMQAVLGRVSTQEMVQDMMLSATRPILYVRGTPQSGKTFTSSLIRDCIAPDRRRIVQLSASELPVEARDLAVLILSRAGVAPATVAALPQADSPNGTDNAWIRSTLLPALRGALAALLGSQPERLQVLWLIIDDLDVVSIPQSGARELLDALYADAEAMRFLRVVLLGLNAALAGVDPAITRTEVLDPPDQIAAETLESCLGALMAERLLAPAPAELKRQVDLVTQMANLLQSMGSGLPRLGRLSQVLGQVWLMAARQWR